MGTLTAGVPRLAEQCSHKLPSSCRLTARPICCACQDKRPHSASYSVYVDGVGFVQRGTRWQGYCWFCREFWNNRVAASGLPPTQTRIPEKPDQKEFLNRWYDFHRGYRLVRTEDGSQVRMAVTGEPLHEVAPGCLPRTLEELRTGRPAALVPSSGPQPAQVSARGQDSPSESIEDTIGALLDEANTQDAVETPVEHRRVSITDLSALETDELFARANRLQQEIAEITAEAARMRSELGIRHSTQETGRSGAPVEHGNLINTNDMRMESLSTQYRRLEQGAVDVDAEVHWIRLELIRRGARPWVITTGSLHDLLHDLKRRILQQFPALVELSSPSTATANLPGPPSSDAGQSRPPRYAMGSTRRERHASLMREVERAREQKAMVEATLNQYLVELRQLESQMRTVENYTRVFGTREEVESQGEDYQSPISGMFNRAWDRYRQAEEQRRNPDPDISVAAAGQSSEGAAQSREETGDENEIPPSLRPHMDFVHTIARFFARHRHVLALDLRSSSASETRRTAWLGFFNDQEVATAFYDRVLAMRNLFPESDVLTPSESLEMFQAGRIESTIFSLVQSIYPNLLLVGRQSGVADTPFSPAAWATWLRQDAARRVEEGQRPQSTRGLDSDASRPAVKTEEEMTVMLECKICYSQCADTALLPCGHMAMCRWCAGVQIPARPNDRTQPLMPAKCPTCRKKVTKMVRIYT